MIIYNKGTVFNSGAEAIVNTVNCVGVMGAGLALEFALRYPEMYNDYQCKCKAKQIMVGKIDYYQVEKEIVVNFPTKWHFKFPSKIEWIEMGLQDFVCTYKSMGIKSVAFPKLGALNGGLDWGKVQFLIEKYLSKIDIPVYICLDESSAEGVEKKMLDLFNSLPIEVLGATIRLTERQKSLLNKNKPFFRFWQIKEMDGIGITTYSNIFKYCKYDFEHNLTSL